MDFIIENMKIKRDMFTETTKLIASNCQTIQRAARHNNKITANHDKEEKRRNYRDFIKSHAWERGKYIFDCFTLITIRMRQH